MSRLTVNECSQALPLGCFCNCDIIDTGVLADVSGIHTLSYHIESVKWSHDIDAVLGENIMIDAALLATEQDIYFRLTKPDGTIFSDVDGNRLFYLRVEICIKVSKTDESIVEGVNLSYCG